MVKAEFKIIDVEREITNLKEILHNGSDEQNGKIFVEYPILLRRLKKSSSDTESNKIISKFFHVIAKDTKGKAIKYKQVFQKIWNIVNDDFIDIISLLLNTKIKDDKIFTINVTFSPVEVESENEFSIYLKTKTRKLKDIVFHGVTKILLEEKIEKITEEESELKYIFINLVLLSVLNDTKMQKISIYKSLINPLYSNIVISNSLLPSVIEKMYEEKKSFDLFLKDAWKVMLKDKESILSQFNNAQEEEN